MPLSKLLMKRVRRIGVLAIAHDMHESFCIIQDEPRAATIVANSDKASAVVSRDVHSFEVPSPKFGP